MADRLGNCGLHHSALLGNDKGVLYALQAGADVNALDSVGRSAIMCVVAGENWRDMNAYDALFMTPSRLSALKILLKQPEISLLTLNLSHSSMNGVIPLGMAAWLNQPLAVRTLLEDSAECVSVDGMDSHGATALMYAARDGNLEVAQTLLLHGARPDFRDHNHRTALHFAQAYPRVLWLCEALLRHHRWRESKSADQTRLSSVSDDLVELARSSLPFTENLEPPPLSIFTREATSRLTNALISSIRASDVPFFHSLLFSPSIPVSSPPSLYPMSVPILVNTPDNKGWSPIHHCVAVSYPSIQVLDALYCAGADVSLFTIHEQQTPLHILARSSQLDGTSNTSNSLATFVLHLIQDLRAPLSARDKDDETCIHIAAEHGKSLDLLMLFLECDVSDSVRNMTNSRGLTPEDVCKAEFLSAFRNHSLSSSSAPFDRLQSTDSFSSFATTTSRQTSVLSTYPANHLDAEPAIYGLLDNLHKTSPSLKHTRTPAHIQHLEDCLDDANDQCNAIVVHFRGRIEEASRVLRELEGKAARIDSLRNMIVLAARGRLLAQELTPLQPRRRQRDSEDSQATFISAVSDASSMSPSLPRALQGSHASYATAGTQTGLLDFVIANSVLSPDTAWSDSHIESSDFTACRTCFEDLCNVERELAELHESAANHGFVSPTTLSSRLQRALKKKRKLTEKIRELDVNDSRLNKPSGPSKVKAWIKRIVVPRKLEVILDVDNKHCRVGREVKSLDAVPKDHETMDLSIYTALQTSQVVLENAHHDLKSIGDHLATALQLIECANHSISRTQRIFKRAVKKRETMITDLHTKSAGNGFLSPNHMDSTITNRTSLNSISTIYSTTSSIAATLTEHSDEDTRNIRRLLLRKIEAQISDAWDEVDKVALWLQIVKEAIRGVKRRAYL